MNQHSLRRITKANHVRTSFSSCYGRRAFATLVRFVVLLAFAIFVVPPTAAQSRPRVEIALALGRYTPTGQTPNNILYGCPTYCGLQLSIKQQSAVAVGGRMTAWLANRAGIEASLWYSPSGVSKVGQYSLGSLNQVSGGDIVAATARVVLSLPAQTRTLSVLIMGGPAVIHRSGDYWARWQSTTRVGGSFGIGLDIHPGHRFSVRAGIEDYVYEFSGPYDFNGAGDLHHDIVFSLSTGHSFLARRR